MKIIKKTLKILAWTLGIIVLAGGIGYLVLDKKLPEGVEGPEAEAMADKMLKAVNKEGWDSLAFLQFTYFKGDHKILWDKQRNLAEVQWDGNRVLIDPSTMKGLAWKDGERAEGEQHDKLVEKAITLFWNDSFWVIAPFKIRDPGTVRKTVTLDDGSKALLVTYTSGGRSPGDHYLWHLNAEGVPIAWQLWVKIFPIGGIKQGWEEWKTLPGGAKVAMVRSHSMKELRFKDIQGGGSLAALGYEEDVFAPLVNNMP
jgi:hypothetical protein